jgi:hypothetical protein
MPFRQSPDRHTPYSIIAFDKDGIERQDDPDGSKGLMSQRLIPELAQAPPTDIFLFTHGWKGDLGAAISQYNSWIDGLTRLAADAAPMGSPFRPMWIGLHWPSQPWGDEDLGGLGGTAGFAAIDSDHRRAAPATMI